MSMEPEEMSRLKIEKYNDHQLFVESPGIDERVLRIKYMVRRGETKGWNTGE